VVSNFIDFLINILLFFSDFDQIEYKRRMKSKLKLIFTTLLVLSSFAISWGACLLYFVMVCNEGCIFTYLKDISFETGFAINGTVNFMVSFVKSVLSINDVMAMPLVSYIKCTRHSGIG
jgi:hypothetical protein